MWTNCTSVMLGEVYDLPSITQVVSRQSYVYAPLILILGCFKGIWRDFAARRRAGAGVLR